MKLKKFIIATREKETAEEIRLSTCSCSGIEIHLGSFADIPAFDCVATAGNSFGLMDAGIDLAILRFFGSHIQERIQKKILEEYLGEQPVGTAFIMPTDLANHPWVAHAPTMRTPMNVSGTDHVYLATWATLLAVHHQNQIGGPPIEVLVIPAFCAGTGGIRPFEVGLQIRIAYEHFNSPPEYLNPSVAQARQERIHYGGRWGFEHPRNPE